MYDCLNYNIEGCEYDDESTLSMWYDSVCEYTIGCLEEFSEEDWKKLFKELPNKSVLWQKRFVDCLNDSQNQNQLNALIMLSNTNDLELFSLVISTLLGYDVSNVENIDELYEKVENSIPLVGEGYKKEFNEFLEKKNRVR